MYVTIEGIDFSGKTTQVEALKKIYAEAVFTVEPGGTIVGEKIREIALHNEMDSLARSFLFLADRAEHSKLVLEPNIDKLIISDRSLISGIAYAWDDGDKERLKELNLFVTRGIKPDLAILLQLDETTLKARMMREKPDQIEKQGVESLMRVQERLKDSAELLGIPMIPIDAALETDKITNDIKEMIDENIKEKSK